LKVATEEAVRMSDGKLIHVVVFITVRHSYLDIFESQSLLQLSDCLFFSQLILHL